MTRLMPSHLSRWLWIGLAVQLTPSSLQGQKPGQPYVSPLKNFSITVPNYAFGTKVQKSNKGDGGFVVFIGGFGDLERIEYVRVDSAAIAAQDSATRLLLYEGVLDNVVTANHAQILAAEPLSGPGETQLYALVQFPEASQVVDGKTGKRMDSFRGVLVLTRGAFLYMLYVEAGGLFGAGEPGEKQVARGKDAVQRLLGEISFQGSPIPVVRDTARAPE